MSDATDTPMDPKLAEGREAAKTLSPAYLGLLDAWEKSAQNLAIAKSQEISLRNAVYQFSFENPKEGTNSKPLHQGWLLKAKLPIDRKVDEAQISSVCELLAEVGGSLDAVVRFEPKLNVAVYKALPENQREIVDLMVTAKPGTPQLEIVLPKKAVKA